MNDPIIASLITYIAQNILKQPNRALSPVEPIISSGLIDSFSLVDLALFVEESYGVHLDDTELNRETFDSVNQLADIIRYRQR